MARRLLGADSATVFNIQEPEEETANQVPPSSGLLREIAIAVSPHPVFFIDATLGISSVEGTGQVEEKHYFISIYWAYAMCQTLC